jgi:hypothetical protein
MIKKLLFGISSVVVILIVAAIAGHFGRNLAQKTVASKEEIEIKHIIPTHGRIS